MKNTNEETDEEYTDREGSWVGPRDSADDDDGEDEGEEGPTCAPISKMVDKILKGDDTSNFGCDNPIALIRSNSEPNTWLFTNSNAEIVRSEEVVFGNSPEELIAALEIYLGVGDPRLQFVRNHSWGNMNKYVEVMEYPIFHCEVADDAQVLMVLLKEYESIQVIYGGDAARQYMEIRELLALNRYSTAEAHNVVTKNPKAAKAFLSRLKSRKKSVEKTFLVKDIHECIYGIQLYVPSLHRFKVHTVGYDAFVDFISLLAMFEGVYGPNSRYKIEPFRQLIKKWRTSTKISHAFKKGSMSVFIAWLDREAALPDNTEPPIIQAMEVKDVIALLTKKT